MNYSAWYMNAVSNYEEVIRQVLLCDKHKSDRRDTAISAMCAAWEAYGKACVFASLLDDRDHMFVVQTKVDGVSASDAMMYLGQMRIWLSGNMLQAPNDVQVGAQ